jgi:DnaJ-class molecular chaperone
MASFEEIGQARRLLGLGEAVTLKEIKQAYKRMAFRNHPDRGGDDPAYQEKMKKLNWAHKLLTEYCNQYRYTFTEEDVARAYPEETYLRRYAYGWFDGP